MIDSQLLSKLNVRRTALCKRSSGTEIAEIRKCFLQGLKPRFVELGAWGLKSPPPNGEEREILRGVAEGLRGDDHDSA